MLNVTAAVASSLKKRSSFPTGLGQGDATINLDIDRDKVRAYGLTVAQVYQQIAAKLTTTTTAETRLSQLRGWPLITTTSPSFPGVREPTR